MSINPNEAPENRPAESIAHGLAVRTVRFGGLFGGLIGVPLGLGFFLVGALVTAPIGAAIGILLAAPQAALLHVLAKTSLASNRTVGATVGAVVCAAISGGLACAWILKWWDSGFDRNPAAYIYAAWVIGLALLGGVLGGADTMKWLWGRQQELPGDRPGPTAQIT